MTLPRFTLRLSHKIAALGLIGIVGLGLVGIIYSVGLASQEGHRIVAATARAISDRADKLTIDLLEGRSAEKDFLLSSDERHVARHAQVAKVIDEDLEALKRLGAAAGHAMIAAKSDQIRRGYETYVKHIGAMVELRRKQGLTENLGLEGALRKSVHEIETKINEFSDPEITATLLMMRRHEKDFMLRRDPKYGVEMK